MQYSSIEELIDSGDERFKLGLAWYVIYRINKKRQDDYAYGFQYLKLSIDEIKELLNERYNWLLLHGYKSCSCEPHRYHAFYETYSDLKLIINSLRKEHSEYIPQLTYNNIASTIGDYMYHLLVNPDKYFRSSEPSDLANLIGLAANRVIRNCFGNGIFKDNKPINLPHCTDYVKTYHRSKGFRYTTGW